MYYNEVALILYYYSQTSNTNFDRAVSDYHWLRKLSDLDLCFNVITSRISDLDLRVDERYNDLDRSNRIKSGHSINGNVRYGILFM